MTLFRPCIDLHRGHVKQIVGSSLRDEGNAAQENFVSEKSAAWYAEQYRRDGLSGGHLIMLGPGNDEAAQQALAAWPGGLQVGGGITPLNALQWLAAGASKVIVTSWLFVDGELDWERLEQISNLVGKEQLVMDLSCRKTAKGWKIATNRWQTISETALTPELFERAARFCSEFLVHAVDAEGLQAGVDFELISLLANHSPIPVTYAGGAKATSDLRLVDRLSEGRVDLTIGSALDLFGGAGASYQECVAWNHERNFGTPFPVKHVGSNRPLSLIGAWIFELVKHLPALWRLRKELSQNGRLAEPRVLLFSDNLDEVNGIAISARLLVKTMQKEGRDVRLLGTAYHTRNGNGVVEPNGTTLLPQVFSMEQVGYSESELAVPSMREMIRFLRRYRPNLIEIETPSSGGMMMLIAAKICKIKQISHYRTDITAYLEALASNRKIVSQFTRSWVRLFNRLSAPVIVPSTHFEEKLQKEAGLKPHQVVLLPRGADLKHYSPDRREGYLWANHFAERGEVRWIYVGRVSEEKELPFLVDLWRKHLVDHPDEQLLIVGQGPYLERMKEKSADLSSICYTGMRRGTYLAGLYAEADWFLFPSGTDTFGNVVVESLASGTPALVSDSGGPRDIVEAEKSGKILPFRSCDAWLDAMKSCSALTLSGEAEQWRKEATARAQHFTLNRSSDAFWNFYTQLHHRSR